MDENELKPCPFCGGEAHILGTWVPRVDVYAACCASAKDCPAKNVEQDEQGGYACEFSTEKEAVDNWNTRPLEDALTAEVTALRARVAELEAEARWVSVEQRLPEVDGHYIVSVREKETVRFGDWETRTVYECVFSDGNWFTANDVVSWRPLPAPPEAE